MAGGIQHSGSVEHAVSSLAGSERALRRFVVGLDPVDPARPSRLPDWTIGHVMTHIARNADSILSMLAGRPQYPHGRAGRNADIDAGATRSWAELVDDVVATSEAVESAVVDRGDWTGTVAAIGGERPCSDLPLIRQREVEVHRSDLGLGHDFDDMPADYVARDLQVLELAWATHMPTGTSALPARALGLAPAARLSWLLGRTEVEGLAPAHLL